jgi:hypothetical protein
VSVEIPNSLPSLYKKMMYNPIILEDNHDLYRNIYKANRRDLSLDLTERSLVINQLPSIEYNIRSSGIDSDDDEEYRL